MLYPFSLPTKADEVPAGPTDALNAALLLQFFATRFDVALCVTHKFVGVPKQIIDGRAVFRDSVVRDCLVGHLNLIAPCAG